MLLKIEDLIAWAGLLVTVVAQLFHLRGRIAILEARQNDLRTDIKQVMDRIDHRLENIEAKLDRKADK